MNPEQIANALGGARRDGKGFVAHCPCHEDSHPSLALQLGDDGRLLWHCRAGCSQDEICDALRARGLLNGYARDPKPRCTVPRAPSPYSRPAVASPPAPDGIPSMRDARLGAPSDSWCYRDADDRPLFWVARYGTPTGKEIRPWTWADSRWQQRAYSAPRPLYGLDRLARMADAPVLVCEGEKCADAAHVVLGADTVCMSWSGGAAAVSKTDWTPLQGRRVLVWPDRDPPGRKAAGEIRRLLPQAELLDVPGDDGYDVADLLEAAGDEAVRRFVADCPRMPAAIAQAAPAAPDWTQDVPSPEGTMDAPRGESKRLGPKYSIVLARDFLVREDLAYFIKGIWQQDTFGVTWGPSGGGKSYVTADMVLHVVSGREWCGRRVRRAGVVYLGAEGARSMERRFIAMCDHAGLNRSGLPLAILSGALHMLKDIDGAVVAIADAAQQLRKQFEVSDVLLIIDTLARSAPGMDENGPEDMGAYVGAVDRIRLDLGMAVVVVHHAGKDIARGARGHGALKAAADCELMIADHQVSVEKLRDGATGAAIRFTLHPVELGLDQDGDPITACWVEYADEANARRGKPVRISPTTQIGCDALREAVRDHGERLPATSSLPEGRTACTVEQWRAKFYARTADREAESRKKAFQRAKDDLMARKIIGAWETRVWIW
jgi:hypothetical protein